MFELAHEMRQLSEKYIEDNCKEVIDHIYSEIRTYATKGARNLLFSIQGDEFCRYMETRMTVEGFVVKVKLIDPVNETYNLGVSW